jgi:hypothetical protein
MLLFFLLVLFSGLFFLLVLFVLTSVGHDLSSGMLKFQLALKSRILACGKLL